MVEVKTKPEVQPKPKAPETKAAVPVSGAADATAAGAGIVNPDKSRSALEVIAKGTTSIKEGKKTVGVTIDIEEEVESLMKSSDPIDKARGYDFKLLELRAKREGLRAAKARNKNNPEVLLQVEKAIQETEQVMKQHHESRQKITYEQNGETKIVPDQAGGVVKLAEALGADPDVAQSNPLKVIEAVFNETMKKGDKKQVAGFLSTVGKVLGEEMSAEELQESINLLQKAPNELFSQKSAEGRKWFWKAPGILGLVGLLMAWLGLKSSGAGGGQGGH